MISVAVVSEWPQLTYTCQEYEDLALGLWR
jgi:hypothetical protein